MGTLGPIPLICSLVLLFKSACLCTYWMSMPEWAFANMDIDDRDWCGVGDEDGIFGLA